MKFPQTNVDNKVHTEAAYWFTRINSGEASDQEMQEFRRWHNQDPEHQRCYRYIRFFCDTNFQATQPESEHIHTVEPAGSSIKEQHWWRWLSGGLLFLLGMAVMFYVMQSQILLWPPSATTSLLSRESRLEHVLPDGSLLVLNKGTQLRYNARRRQVDLDQGQVYFDVKPNHDLNPQNMLTIRAGVSEIRVDGTRFDLLKEGSRVRITVESGNVEVAVGSWWRKRVRLLIPGQSVEVDEWQGMQPVAAAPVASRISWVQGKFYFDSTPLPEVLSQLNRYRSQILILSPGEGLEELQFTGEFPLDEPDTVLEAMIKNLPIQIGIGNDGLIRPDARKVGMLYIARSF